MKFEILNKELWPIAKSITDFYRKRGITKFKIEKSLNDTYRFRPTIFFKKRNGLIVIEVTNKPVFQEYFEGFVKDCLVTRENFEIYMAFPSMIENEEVSFTPCFLSQVKKYGVGIILVDNNNTIIHTKAVKCFLRITPNELVAVIYNKSRILQIVDKFNVGQHIDAIRDITELVEKVVLVLALKAAQKRKIIPCVKEIETKFDFEGLINLMSAPNWKDNKGQIKPQKRYFDENLKNDLKSYKGARNLSHHPRNSREEKILEQQLLERMRMGIRLVQYVCKIAV